MQRPASHPELTSKLDLELIVFDGDRDLRRSLTSDKRFRRIKSELGTPELVSQRRALLLSALQLTPGVAPDLFRALDHVTTTLGTNLPVELYCVSDREINAFVTPPESGRVLLGLTSEAIERLDDGEVRFVLGHELGHVLYDHLALSPEAFVDHEDVAPLHLAQLCAWKRYAELTADRVGLLCCDDFDTAVRAFFKLTSGLSATKYLQNAEHAADQIAALGADALDSTEHDWFATHPYSPLRVRALDLFSRSETYHRLLGRGGDEARFHSLLGKSKQALTEAELEAEVREIMALMDPAFLNESSDQAPRMREFLALAGVAVATADGEFDKVEKQMLGSLVGRRGVLANAKQLLKLSARDHRQRLEAVAGDLVVLLSPTQRMKLIEDLVAVAMADRRLFESEVGVIAEVSELLMVDPSFATLALRRALQALD